MMAAPGSALQWEGQTVLDRTGEKIGKIEEIFLVEETGRPEWALVKVGRLKSHATLVPLTRARPSDKGVEVEVEKDVVSEAPQIEPNSEPTEEQVEQLYRHYGLVTPNGGPSQANAGSAPANGTTGTPSQLATGHASPDAPPAGGTSRDVRDAPVGDLLTQAKEEGSNLVGQELRLAKAEMAAKAKDVGIGAGLAGGAGYVANLAAIAFVITAILALSQAMAGWLAALIVTVALAAVAGVLALSAKKKIENAGPPIPAQTVESLKQTMNTVKEEATWGLGQTK